MKLTRTALLSLTLACGACDRSVTSTECTEMLDHYIDMEIASDPQLAPLPAAQQAAAREMKMAIKKGEKSYAEVESQCRSEVKRHEYDCAIKAKTPNDWEACID